MGSIEVTQGKDLPVGPAEILKDTVSEFVEFARAHSPFYSNLYSSLPKGPLSLSQLPIVDPIAFWAANPTAENTIQTTPQVDGVVFASGGSTAAPKITLVSKAELKAVTQYVSSCMVSAGVRPGDRVANFFVAGDLYSSFLAMCTAVLECPIPLVLLPLGFAIPPPKMVAHIQAQKATVLLGISTTLQKIAGELLKTGQTCPSVHLMLFSGEHLYEDGRALLRRGFPNAVVRSLGYGGMDSGLVGRPADDVEDVRIHKVNHPTVVLEIVDENGQPITKPGQPGSVVSTNLCRRLVPVIRYPVGDLGEWVDYTKGLFRVLGRDQKELRIGVVSVEAQQLRTLIEQNLSAKDKGTFHGAQLHLQRKDLKDQLIFRIACSPENQEDASRKLEEALVKLKPWFKDHVAAGFIQPLQVEWVSIDALDVSQRTGKTPLVVDNRK